MKIVTWNCNGALRKKTKEVDSLDADILIIQECENPSESTKEYRKWAGNYLWTGTSKNKGVGVFPKNGSDIKKLEWAGTFKVNGFKRSHPSHRWQTSDLKLFLPFRVNDHFTVLGVWTKGSDSEVFAYMGQFWKYLQIHDTDLSGQKTLIIGDFNSNAIWDKVDRWWNHSGVINELSDLGIESLYHYQTAEAQGAEKQPTFFLHRKNEKPYHIDYAFLSKDLLPHSGIRIGRREDWIAVSDHMPVSVTISS